VRRQLAGTKRETQLICDPELVDEMFVSVAGRSPLQTSGSSAQGRELSWTIRHFARRRSRCTSRSAAGEIEPRASVETGEHVEVRDLAAAEGPGHVIVEHKQDRERSKLLESRAKEVRRHRMNWD
jgi:hypothetical protein